jgi:branched-chain amino acid transport system permease protein
MLQLLLAGLAMGAIYALIALAFTMVAITTGGLNFAMGQLVTIGAFLSLTFGKLLGMPLVPSVSLSIVCMSLLGIAFERTVFRPLGGKSLLNFALGTTAIGIVLENLALVIWGPDPRGMPPVLGDERRMVDLMGARLSTQHLFVAIFVAIVLVFLYYVMTKTRLGRMMRATAQDREMARLLGINAGVMTTATFVFSNMLAGLAGWLLAPEYFVYPQMGTPLLSKAFICTIIGGWGSLPGSVVGGLALGLLEVLVAAFLSSAFRDVIVFLVLIALLLLRPQGIFGEAVAEKA